MHYINNGVDAEQFPIIIKDNFRVDDPSGGSRHIQGGLHRLHPPGEQLGLPLDAARECKGSRVRFLVWGDGDERPALMGAGAG